MANIVMADAASGEWTTEGFASFTEPNGVIKLGNSVKKIGEYAFYMRPGITGLYTNATSIEGYAFSSCTGLLSVHAPFAETKQSTFSRCTHLKTGVVKSVAGGWCFQYCSALQIADIRTGQLGGNAFNGDSSLSTIVLRASSIQSIFNLSAFTGTPFASGGSGGTIYIPETLYDHLGDGTALDYKAATNWSTLDGYGTVTWAKIEGSQYENAYADGTPIS